LLNRPRKGKPQAGSGQTEKWQRQLNNRIPLVGSWLRIEAARLLRQAAEQGNPQATRILALAYISSSDEAVRDLAGQTLEDLSLHNCIDAIWLAWMDTRAPGLLQLLLRKNWVASAPPRARVISALRLERPELVTKGGGEVIEPLVEALRDSNPDISRQAQFCLLHLEIEEAVQCLADAWLRTRDDELGEILRQAGYLAPHPGPARVYTAFLSGRDDVIRGATSDLVPSILDACQDADQGIREKARRSLSTLLNPSAIDGLCAAWTSTRQPWLADILKSNEFMPQSPGVARVLCALKCLNRPVLQDLQPVEIEPLLRAADDPDDEVASQVEPAARGLAVAETRDELCRAAAEEDHPLARKVCLEEGFEPRQPDQRALFYFMTEQWDRYQALDFDQRLLRAVFETSGQTLRSQITRKLQKAGRMDFLTILAGSDYHSRSRTISEGETEVLVNLLADHQEWTRLWNLALELPLAWSIQILRRLMDSTWLPDDESAVETFQNLSALTRDFDPAYSEQLKHMLPPAYPRSNNHVSGRVNDVAFHPSQPVIALATGNRKVVLWNYQHALIEDILDGFDHSVGKVVYTKDGILVCGERTNTTQPCGIFTWKDSHLNRIGEHASSVTSVELVGEQRILTTGRDKQVFLWDASLARLLSQKNIHFWPRGSRVSPDGDQAVLLDQGMAVISLPEIDFLGGITGSALYRNGSGSYGISRCAAFLPEPGKLVLGKTNGRVIVYTKDGKKYRPDRLTLATMDSEVQGLEVLPDHSLVIVATARGEIHYFAWPVRSRVASVKFPGERLTSLCLSLDGSFMASGDSNASVTLWDLRVLDLPRLASQPFSACTVRDMATIHALAGDPDLPIAGQVAAKFMDCALQYRNRFDIQIADVPTIRIGEFDIIVE